MTKTSVGLFLANELSKRKLRNEKYSLRAFARDLGLSPGRLADILNGRRRLGPELAQRIVNSLNLNAEAKVEFEDLFARQSKRPLKSAAPFYQLNEDQLSALVDWEYFATLSLLETRDVSLSPQWLAARLGISSERAQEVLDRLVRLNLIVLKRSRYHLVHKHVTTTEEVPSSALKEAHRQNIQQALVSLYEDSVSLRDISSISLAVDLAKLPEAKKLIKSFRQKMSRLLEKGNKTEVYNLNIQLFPITKKANTLAVKGES